MFSWCVSAGGGGEKVQSMQAVEMQQWGSGYNVYLCI